MTDETGPDWADEEARAINEQIAYSGDFKSDAVVIASALRKAKAAGMREASELCGDDNFYPDHDRWFLEHRLFERADKLEAGN